MHETITAANVTHTASTTSGVTDSNDDKQMVDKRNGNKPWHKRSQCEEREQQGKNSGETF